LKAAIKSRRSSPAAARGADDQAAGSRQHEVVGEFHEDTAKGQIVAK
jgi:hypothetical protein